MKMKYQPTEQFALNLDSQDPLSHFRDKFCLPPGKIYLDGNSLGLPAKDAEKSVLRVMDEWKNLAIDGWLHAQKPWFHFVERLGAQAAPLVGAQSNEVMATGSTTVNIHSLISSFYNPRGQRTKILADVINFPSDIYALKGQIELRGLNPDDHLVLVPTPDGKTLDHDQIIEHMTDGIAVALFPSVMFRSGQLLDMPLLTKKAHEKGILIGFDCSHSVGAVPHHFDDWDIDFALWCSYKYLNGGPGSTGFLYVNQKHFDLEPLIAGWFGVDKSKMFDMLLDFVPAPHAGRWQISSPFILSSAPLEASLQIALDAGIENIREKSLNLTSYLICLIDAILAPPPYNFKIGTPRDPHQRGGHIALERDHTAWGICCALKDRGVIPDFRPPDMIRFAPVALYNTYHEVWRTVQLIKQIIDQKLYDKFQNQKPEIT